MNSHRPISIYEITAMYLEIFRIHPEVYYEMIKTAEFVKWIPDAILNFSPIMSLKNLPYQSANPRIRARTDVLFNGGAILPYSSSIAPSLTSTTFFEAVESQSCLDENETKHLSHEQGNILPVSTPSNLNRMDSTKSTATHMTVASEATITLANSKTVLLLNHVLRNLLLLLVCFPKNLSEAWFSMLFLMMMRNLKSTLK